MIHNDMPLVVVTRDGEFKGRIGVAKALKPGFTNREVDFGGLIVLLAPTDIRPLRLGESISTQ